MGSRFGKFIDSLKLRLENIIHTLKYALPFAATAFFAQELKGQGPFPSFTPSGVINPFISYDNTEAAARYNALNSGTKAERDALVDAIIKASRVHTISGAPDVIWNCSHWSLLQAVNAHDWGDNVYSYESGKLLYNGYKDFVLSEIYANGGTLADAGKDGLPMFGVSLYDPVNLPGGHGMDLVFTGNNMLNPDDGNTIEPRDGLTNQKPGDGNIPLNCESVTVTFVYIYKNQQHEKNLTSMRILEFKIVNGQKILTYNINDNPYYKNELRFITERESDPPVIDIKQSTAPDSLIATIRDANIKSIWYTVDGGAKIPLMTEVLDPVTEKKIAIKMNLPNGIHQIKVGTDDYFRYVTEKSEQRNIEAIINAPPVIVISTPTEGQIFTKDGQLIYSITDTDFASAWYSLDNGTTKTTVNQNGTIALPLTDGLYTILMEATDKKPQTTRVNRNFQINRPPIINIITPEEGKVYDKDVKLQFDITDKDFASAWYSLDNGTTKISLGQSGTIPLQLTNGLYTLLLQATDAKPQTTSDSRNFEIKKTTGIEDPTLTEGIKIYPIPVTDYLNIEYKTEKDQIIYRELFSVDGRIIYNDRIEVAGEQSNRMDMSRFAKGVYWLVIRTEKGGSSVYKVVIN